MFVENVLIEVKGKAALVALDQTGSITLQRLLPLSSPDQVGEVLAELGGETGSAFKTVSCDRCGGHVVESAVRQMSKWTGKIPCFSETGEKSWNHTKPTPTADPCVPPLCPFMFRVLTERVVCYHRGRRRGELWSVGGPGVVFKPGGERQLRRVHQTYSWLTRGAHTPTCAGRLCWTATNRVPSR